MNRGETSSPEAGRQTGPRREDPRETVATFNDLSRAETRSTLDNSENGETGSGARAREQDRMKVR